MANSLHRRVTTSLGVPLPCTFSHHSPLTSKLKASVPVQDRSFVGGRLQSYAARWRWFFGADGPGRHFHDKEALRLVEHGWLPQLSSNPVQRRWPRERILEPGPQATATDAMVKEYLDKRIIEEVSAPPPPPRAPLSSLDLTMVYIPGVPFRVPRTVYPWVHDFFLVPKPHSTKWRGITNAKLYNEYTPKIKFKLPGVSQLRAMLRPQDFMAGFDVQDFFPHVAVHRRMRDHLLFRHRRQGENMSRWYRYVGLCFGVTDAPRSCMRVLRPCLAFLRAMDTRLAMFIDDGLVADRSEAECIVAFQRVLRILDYLGFILHPEKTKPRPSQKRLFLGSVVDASHRRYVTLRLPTSKLKGLRRTATATRSGLASGSLRLRDLASMLGKARAARDCVTVCYLMTRSMLRWQNEVLSLELKRLQIRPRQQPFYDDELLLTLDGPALPREKHAPWWATLINWDVRVLDILPKDWVAEHWAPLHQELHFWATELRFWNGKWLSGAPPAHGARPLHFDSDASNTGGGLVMDDPLPVEARWHWRKLETPNSINWKELVSVEMGLRAAAKQFGAATHQHVAGGGQIVSVSSDKSQDLPQTTWSTGSSALPLKETKLAVEATGVASQGQQQPTHLLQGASIHGRVDNTAAIAYINKQGGPVPSLSMMAERLWRYLLQHQAWIKCTHLAGVLNVRADRASKWRDDVQEWRLSDEAFYQVEKVFGPHSVDLFASRRNTMLPRFFSRWLDPDAAATDALSRRWSSERNAYAHPPIALIPKIIEKVREEGAEITLITPLWASQAWISSLLELSVATPRLLLATHLFTTPSGCQISTEKCGWRTVAWRICGNACASKELRSRLRNVLWTE